MRDSTTKLIAKYEAAIAVMKQDDGVNTFQYNYNNEGWADVKSHPSWSLETTEYRVKPKPAECWIFLFDTGVRSAMTYSSKESCLKDWGSGSDGKAVLFREVTE